MPAASSATWNVSIKLFMFRRSLSFVGLNCRGPRIWRHLCVRRTTANVTEARYLADETTEFRHLRVVCNKAARKLACHPRGTPDRRSKGYLDSGESRLCDDEKQS